MFLKLKHYSKAFVNNVTFIRVYLMCSENCHRNIRPMSTGVKASICYDASLPTPVMDLLNNIWIYQLNDRHPFKLSWLLINYSYFTFYINIYFGLFFATVTWSCLLWWLVVIVFSLLQGWVPDCIIYLFMYLIICFWFFLFVWVFCLVFFLPFFEILTDKQS